MMYDPTRVGLNVILPPCDSLHPFPQNMLSLEPGMTMVRVVTHGKGDTLTYRPKLISCVSTLQYISGIGYPFWCLTPHQLYTRLVSANHPNIENSEVINVNRKT